MTNLMNGRTLMKASHQWASRPDDQRFASLIDLDAYCQGARERSTGKVVSSRRIEAQPVGDDTRALQVVGPNGAPVLPTNWAFGQLATRAGAPAAYLRDLPSALAADCINYGLKFSRDIKDLGVLLYRDGEDAELRAVTGPNYGRVWNAQLTRALVERFGDGLTGDFRVPGEFGKDVEVTEANTTLYASDRDLFVFLADEKRRIEVKDRRDGKSGSLARGFFMWNSEVGKTSFGLAMFLFDYVCCNRIVWGAEQYHEIRIAHTSSAPVRWLEEVTPMIEEYAAASAAPIQRAIEAAQHKKVDDVQKFLQARFTKAQAAAIQTAHFNDEARPIETLWDAATAITAYARGIPHQDARVNIEREAGRVLDLAA